MNTIPKAWRLTALLLGIALLSGCGQKGANFSTNEVFVLTKNKQKLYGDQKLTDLRNVLTALYGTPNDPAVPQMEGLDKTLDIRKLRLAAGPVYGSESGQTRGLFRRHCAHCHGLAGDGDGPTAQFLNPYPRDFRRGTFKFKSTKKGMKPTHDDLTRILINGIPGTAMPSFKLLPKDEVEALVHYVKYLAIRGETERFLIEAIGDLDDDGRLFDRGDEKAQVDQKETILEHATTAAASWAEAAPTEIAKRAVPIELTDKTKLTTSARLGRELFYGKIANCIKCHGDSGLGDGELNDYDDWTKDWITGLKNPKDPKETAIFLKHGAHKPRNIRPRNLRQGVFRGGHRPIDIFWRIKNGIDGTPMPGVPQRKPSDPPTKPGLTDEQIWQLVDYVRNWLPYESLSKPPKTKVYQRDRL